jgi:hypothetical protein
VLGFAAPARADDMDICRDKQTEAKARLEACEKVMAVALAVRGNALLTKHNNDKAIEAFTAAHYADSGNDVLCGSAARHTTMLSRFAARVMPV